MQDWLTTKEAAERLGIDQRSVVKAINRGTLRAVKRGRDYLIEAAEVVRYAAVHQRSGDRSVRSDIQTDTVTHEGTEGVS